MTQSRIKPPARFFAPAVATQSGEGIIVEAGAGTPSPRVALIDNTVDVCSSLFAVCRHCEATHLMRHGVVCTFDVEGGTVPAWLFRALRSTVEMVIADIAAGIEKRMRGAVVNVTLRRQGALWALAIAENVSGPAGTARAQRRVAMLRALTHHLSCICRAVPTASGSAVAVAFHDSGSAPAPTSGMLH